MRIYNRWIIQWRGGMWAKPVSRSSFCKRITWGQSLVFIEMERRESGNGTGGVGDRRGVGLRSVMSSVVSPLGMGSQQTSHSALAGAAAVFPIARNVAQVQRFRQAAIVRRILALAGCFGPTKEKKSKQISYENRERSKEEESTLWSRRDVEKQTTIGNEKSRNGRSRSRRKAGWTQRDTSKAPKQMFQPATAPQSKRK